jgi:plastocyanin
LQTLSAAEITGKVKLTGTPPAEKDIPLDAACGKVQPKKITTRHYVVGADSGLANVFVWIKEGATKKGDAPADGPLLDQVGCEYQPYVMGVQVGQKFKVRNSDPLMHNVNATAVVNKGFNFAQVTKGQVNEKSFDKQEVLVRFKCDVHPWMFAYVGVVDHGFFAVTDKDGNFKIAGLPAGKYTVEAYHLKAGKSTQEITVTDSDKKEANFTLSVPAAQ